MQIQYIFSKNSEKLRFVVNVSVTWLPTWHTSNHVILSQSQSHHWHPLAVWRKRADWHSLNLHTVISAIHFVEPSIARSISRCNARSIARSQASYSKPFKIWVMRLLEFSLSFVWFNYVFLVFYKFWFFCFELSVIALVFIYPSRIIIITCLYASLARQYLELTPQGQGIFPFHTSLLYSFTALKW